MANKLTNWRRQIDSIDNELLILLSKRMKIVRKIGQLKKAEGKTFYDNKRWKQILETGLKKGEFLMLSEEFIKNILILIHKYSIKIQKGD